MNTDRSSSFRKVFGGGLMIAGVATLLVLPVVAGTNPLPEGILLFGLLSILGGWALTIASIEKPKGDSQPAMGD